MPLTREQMAKRASGFLSSGDYVNLGIGMPTLVANYIPADKHVTLQSENGLLGIGPFPTSEEVDADLINAGKQTVTEAIGASYFSSADSFGMIRGGHLDMAILGAFEVDVSGNIASWMIPGKRVKGMGGAMDLVSSGCRMIAMMAHTDKSGASKLRHACHLPLTGIQCIHWVITELGVFEIKNQAFYLRERGEDVSIEYIQQHTEGALQIESPPEVIALS